MLKFNNFVLILIILTSISYSDIKSTNGEINFDVNEDQIFEMKLNSIGLGIGTNISPSSNLHVQGNAIISNSLSIGTTNNSSNLYLNGTLGYSIQAVSSNTTLGTSSIVLGNTSNDNITLTLPYAGNVTGRIYTIKKSSSYNNLYVKGGGNTIDDLKSFEMNSGTPLPYLKVISNGSSWYALEKSNESGAFSSDNLIGWWKLDGTSLDAIALDSSTNSNDGTLDGGMTFSGCIQNGIINNALSFDGSDDYINTNFSISAGNTATLSVWVKLDNGGWYVLGNHATIGNFGFVGNQNGTNFATLRYESNDVETIVNGATTNIKDGNWHHLVAVLSPSGGFLYVDGAIENSSATAADWDGGAIFIGSQNGSTNFFGGTIDDARIYNRAFSADEVATLYDLGR